MDYNKKLNEIEKEIKDNQKNVIFSDIDYLNLDVHEFSENFRLVTKLNSYTFRDYRKPKIHPTTDLDKLKSMHESVELWEKSIDVIKSIDGVIKQYTHQLKSIERGYIIRKSDIDSIPLEYQDKVFSYAYSEGSSYGTSGIISVASNVVEQIFNDL